MKHTSQFFFRALLSCILLNVTGISALGNSSTNKTLSGKDPKTVLSKQAVLFIENKGQIRDMEGDPAPGVLFKVEAPGLDLYVTTKGLTYVFLRHEEVN